MSDCEKVIEGNVEEVVSETSVVDLGEETAFAGVPPALTNPTGKLGCFNILKILSKIFLTSG